jgi:parvulin-like peptidyl-prolyl isomerase
VIRSNRLVDNTSGPQRPVPAEFILRLTLTGLLSLLSAPPAPAASIPLDRIAVVVNKEIITQVELSDQVEGYLGMKGVQAKPDSALYQKTRREVMDSMVQEILLAQEADRLGVVVNEAEIDKAVADQMESLRKRFPSPEEFATALKKEGVNEEDLRAENKRRITRQMKAERAMGAKREEVLGKAVAPEADVKARYQKNPTDFDSIRFSMIFFRIPDDAPKGYAAEAKKQAEGLKTQIESGGDFAALARKYSEDTLSAEKGGDMGEMLRAQIHEMDPALDRQIVKMPPKQVGLVSTGLGVYLVRVASKRKGAYQDAAPLIRRMLQGGQQLDSLQSWIKGLREKAYVRENK